MTTYLIVNLGITTFLILALISFMREDFEDWMTIVAMLLIAQGLFFYLLVGSNFSVGGKETEEKPISEFFIVKTPANLYLESGGRERLATFSDAKTVNGEHSKVVIIKDLNAYKTVIRARYELK